DVMAVDIDDRPSEAAPFLRQRFECGDLRHVPFHLHVVVVDDGRKVGDAMGGSEERGLPDLTFLQLTVAENDEGAAVAPASAGGERDAGSYRQSLTERTAGRLNRGPDPFGGVDLER